MSLLPARRWRHEAFGFSLWRPILIAYMARAQIGQGNLDLAMESVSRSFSEIEQGCEGWVEPELYRLRAAILEQLGEGAFDEPEMRGTFQSRA